MNKVVGVRIGNYEIIEPTTVSEECEEITLRELLERELSAEDQKEFALSHNAINIHFMISNETYGKAVDLLKDKQTDPRLAGLNAIVFLSLKQKGRAETGYNPLTQGQFNLLVNRALKEEIPFGFDSCGAQKFIKAIEGHEKEEMLLQMAEPCESTLFSSYWNADAEFFPCSFMEGTEGWEKGIPLDEIENFGKDLWNHERVTNFREKVMQCRECAQGCPVYEI